MSRFKNLEFDEPKRRSKSSKRPPKPVRDAAYYLAQADGERRQRLFENALRMYSRTLENDSTIAAAWVGQVRMLIALEEYPEAELWSGKALERLRNHADLLAGRAQASCRLGESKAAYRFSAFVTKINRIIVHIHADKFIIQFVTQSSAPLKGILKGWLPIG